MTGRTAIACAWLLCAAACTGGSETGNPNHGPVTSTALALELRATTEAYAIGPADGTDGAASGATVIREAWVSFGGRDGGFDFPPEGACGADFHDGQYPADWWSPLSAVDLARGDAVLELDVPLGARCGLVVPLLSQTPAGALPEAAPVQLASHSVVVRGARADGTEFLLLHDEDDELEISAVDGSFDVIEGRPLLLSFEVERWMRDVDLDAASVGDDGVILIDRASNAGALGLFELQAECSLDLYADEDGDLALDPDVDTLLARSDDPEDPCTVAE